MSDLSNIPKQSFFSEALSSPIDASQTSGIVLSDVPEYSPGGETIYLNILDPDNPEIISVTGWNSSTNALSGVTRGVDIYTGAGSSGVAHAAGTEVVIADDWNIFSDIATAVNSKADIAGETFTGPVDFSGASTTLRIPNLTTVERDALGAPTNGMLVYDTTAGEFQYYDGGAWHSVGTASVPNASATVAGIIEMATNAEMGTGTSAGGTGALLVPPNDELVKTSSGAGDENKIPILDANGELAMGFIDTSTTAEASKIPLADGNGDIIVPTTPTDGDAAASKTYVDGAVGILVESGSSTTTVANTTTETTLATFTVDANTLGTDGGVKVMIPLTDFDVRNNNGDTFTVNLKYGATTVATALLEQQSGAGITNLSGSIEAILWASGATNTQVGSASIDVADAEFTMGGVNNQSARDVAMGTAAEDSTGALTMAVTVQWSAAAAANSVTAVGYIASKIV